jgi:hypothetical protein
VSPSPEENLQRHWGRLGVLLGVGLLLGFVYVFLVPPWQHYDEPTQFEYAWLIANRQGIPQPGEYDQRMRREVAASMLEHNFFKGMDFHPNLLSQTEEIWIGISQLGDQPLYYWITALPLRLLRYANIDTQLYAARLTSLFFLLLTLAAAWGTLGELAPADHAWVAWLIPSMLLLIPSFVDLMTSVNNDVGATAFFSLFLWGSVRFIHRRPRLLELAWVLATAILCYFTKATVIVAALLVPLVLLIAFFQARYKPVPWLVTGALVLAGLGGVFLWGNAAAWTTWRTQIEPTRQVLADVPDGRAALAVVQQPKQVTQRALQILPASFVQSIQGKKVTISGWIWADKPVQAALGLRSADNWNSSKTFNVQGKPRYFSTQITIPDSIGRAWIELTVPPIEQSSTVHVYFDQILLVPGAYELDQPPAPAPGGSNQILLEGKSINNLARNASFERGWFKIRPRVLSLVNKVIPGNLQWIMASLSDLRSTQWYYKTTISYLNQTFWARFGWGHVPILGQFTYPILAVITLLGILGGLVFAWQARKILPWSIVLIFFLAATAIWLQTILRGIGSLYGQLLFPSARYAYPAIIPTISLLCLGWYALARYGKRVISLAPKYWMGIYLAFFFGLGILALASIYLFYYR